MGSKLTDCDILCASKRLQAVGKGKVASSLQAGHGSGNGTPYLSIVRTHLVVDDERARELHESMSPKKRKRGPEQGVVTRVAENKIVFGGAKTHPAVEEACVKAVVDRDGSLPCGMLRVLMRWTQGAAARKTGDTTRFDSHTAPTVSIGCYLERLRKYFACSEECYVLALVYMERAGNTHPAMAACVLNIHRLLLIAVMLAAKFHDDVAWGSSHYAAVGGVSAKELNALENAFLRALDWKLTVNAEEYEFYRAYMEAYMAEVNAEEFECCQERVHASNNSRALVVEA